MASEDEGEISSPDPLTQTLDFIASGPPIPFPSSALRSRSRSGTFSKRAPRTRDRDPVSRTKKEYGSAQSFTSAGSPRKQTFELDVGAAGSPQRLLVTVEAEDLTSVKAGATRRRLFGSSSPVKGRRARSAIQDNTTTTTVPVRDGETPRKRGRPRGNGTPHVTATRRRSSTPRKPTPARTTRQKTAEQEDEESFAAIEQGTPTPKKPGRPRTSSLSPEKLREPESEAEPEPDLETEPEPDFDTEPDEMSPLPEPQPDFGDEMSPEPSITPLISTRLPSPARSTVVPESVVSEVDLVEYNDGPDFGDDDEDYFLYEQPLEPGPGSTTAADIQPTIEKSPEALEDAEETGFDDIWMAEVSPPKRRTRDQELGDVSQGSVQAEEVPGESHGGDEDDVFIQQETSLPPPQETLMSDPPRRFRRQSRGASLLQGILSFEYTEMEEQKTSSPRLRRKSSPVQLSQNVVEELQPQNPKSLEAREETELPPVAQEEPQVEPSVLRSEQHEDVEMEDYDDGPELFVDGGNSDYSVDDEPENQGLRDNDTVAHNEDFTMIDLTSVPSFNSSFQGKSSLQGKSSFMGKASFQGKSSFVGKSSFLGKSTLESGAQEELNDSSRLIVDRALESIKQQAEEEFDEEPDLLGVIGLVEEDRTEEEDVDTKNIHIEDKTRQEGRKEASRSEHRSPSQLSRSSPKNHTTQESPLHLVSVTEDSAPLPQLSQSEPQPRPSQTPSPRKIKNLPLSRQLFAAMSARKPAVEPPGIPQPQQPEDNADAMHRASVRNHLQLSVFEEGVSEFPSTILGANTPYPPRTNGQVAATQQRETVLEEAPVAEEQEQVAEEQLDEAIADISETRSSPHKLPTPDETPSPGSVASSDDGDGPDAQDNGVADANETTLHSSPPIIVSREQDDAAQSLPRAQESAISTRPEIRLSSPQPHAPLSDLSMPDTLQAPDSIRRPTLSPIVRAGRTLQNILSDPISPRERRNSLGSPFRSSVTRNSHPPESVPRSAGRLHSQEPASSLRSNTLPVAQDPSSGRSPGTLFGQVPPARSISEMPVVPEASAHEEDPFVRDTDEPQQGLGFLKRSSLSRGSRGFESPIMEEVSRNPTVSSTRAQPPGQGTQREMNEDSRLKALLGTLDNPESRNTTLNSSIVETRFTKSVTAEPRQRDPVNQNRQEHLIRQGHTAPERVVAPAPSETAMPSPDSFSSRAQMSPNDSVPLHPRSKIPSPWMKQAAKRPSSISRPRTTNEREEFSLLSQLSTKKPQPQLRQSFQPPQSAKSAHLSDFFSSPHPVPANPVLYPDLGGNIPSMPQKSRGAEPSRLREEEFPDDEMEESMEVEQTEDESTPRPRHVEDIEWYEEEPSSEAPSRDGVRELSEPTPTPSQPSLLSRIFSPASALGFGRSQTQGPPAEEAKPQQETRANEPARKASIPARRRVVQTDLRRSVHKPKGPSPLITRSTGSQPLEPEDFSLLSQQSPQKLGQNNFPKPQSSKSANLSDFFSSPRTLPPDPEMMANKKEEDLAHTENQPQQQRANLEPDVQKENRSHARKLQVDRDQLKQDSTQPREPQQKPALPTDTQPQQKKPKLTPGPMERTQTPKPASKQQSAIPDPQHTHEDDLANLISPVKEPPLAAVGVPSRKDPAPVKASKLPVPSSMGDNRGLGVIQHRINPPDNQWHPPVPQKTFYKAPAKQNLFAAIPRSAATPYTSPDRNPSTPPKQTDAIEDESFQYEPIPQKKNFTPRPGGASYSMFHPDAAYLAEHPPMQPSSVSQDESSIASQKRRESLRPLPTREMSPSKSCLRSPVKPKKTGRVVEFTSSTLSARNIAEAEEAAYGSNPYEEDQEDSSEEAEPMEADNTIGIDWEAAAIVGDEPAVSQSRETDNGVQEAPETVSSGENSRGQVEATPEAEPKEEPGSGIRMSAIPPLLVEQPRPALHPQRRPHEIIARGLQSPPEISLKEFNTPGRNISVQPRKIDQSSSDINRQESAAELPPQRPQESEIEYASQAEVQPSSPPIPTERLYPLIHPNRSEAAGSQAPAQKLFAQPHPRLLPQAPRAPREPPAKPAVQPEPEPEPVADPFASIPLSQTEWTRRHWMRLEQLIEARKAGKLRHMLQTTRDPGLMRRHPFNVARLDGMKGSQIKAPNKGVCMEVQDWQLEVVKVFVETVGGWDVKEVALRVFALMVGSWAREEENRRQLKRRRDEIAIGYRMEDGGEHEYDGDDSMADSTLDRVLGYSSKKPKHSHAKQQTQQDQRKGRKSVMKRGMEAVQKER
ncbi:uncharacterized protein MKZ38_007788 [Zalerion maritima]|uniref:Uncharacterized protein n=1 Tax=Zalerion maritima TaxID=339359 RepID=A0AAD5RHE2_9PEZI|nr:uncharacterized protein MKZ38_007788 [Zalerion maritima]